MEELIAIETELRESDAVFDIKDLVIDGKDIMALGAKEGPEVGRVLTEVFNCYIEERCTNTKDSLICEAKKIISQINF